LEEARRTYEILNTELHDELPALYDSRILFLVTNLQTLFATENVFHNETAKVGFEHQSNSIRWSQYKHCFKNYILIYPYNTFIPPLSIYSRTDLFGTRGDRRQIGHRIAARLQYATQTNK